MVGHRKRDANSIQAAKQPCWRVTSCGRLWVVTLPLIVAALVDASPGVASWRGWDSLVERLIADGVEPREVQAVFSDPRLPPFTGVEFSPVPPIESPKRYRWVGQPQTVRLARRCLTEHRAAFQRAEARTGVPSALLAALVTVESRCGQNVGKEPVLYRLARLAMANEPRNLAWNHARLCAAGCQPSEEQDLRERARYLEETFYPEVKAVFVVARQLGISVLDLRGSPAGAFGWVQFLPSSFLRFGRDADRDGEVSLFDADDAALSAAEYLKAYGWSTNPRDRRAALWAYNRSSAHGQAVLGLMNRIAEGPDIEQVIRKKASKPTLAAKRPAPTK